MQSIDLVIESGHLLLRLEGGSWILETGSPASFGTACDLVIDGRAYPVAGSYMGIDGPALSALATLDVRGLIGGDILNELDLVLDCPGRTLQASHAQLALEGDSLALDEFMGVPLVQAQIDGQAHAMFFDTGASIGYFQEEGLEEHPPMGVVKDFFPGMGEFETETWRLPMCLAGLDVSMRCGRLPELLGLTLAMAGASGIVGNEVCLNRRVGYFPRRRQLVLA
jgi:hypothetical protein